MASPAPDSGSDQRGRVLIVHAGARGHVRAIADAIAQRIRCHGLVVEVGDASRGMMPPPQDYDAVVLGSPAGFEHSTQLITKYIADYRNALPDVPAALFTVSASGSVRDIDPGGFLAQFKALTGWEPDLAAAFAGGDPLPREGWIGKLVGRGRTAHEMRALRTDWVDVDAFADTIATELAHAAVRAERTEPHVADR